MAPLITLFYGTFVQLPRTKSGDKHELAINRGALWVSPSTGRILGVDWAVASEADLQALVKKNRWTPDDDDERPSEDGETRYTLVRAREELNEFFFPGFIDTHIHAPQYPNSGLFGSSTLLNWLSTYTFPLESSFGGDHPAKPPARARTIYNQVISRTLAHGTTTASYFATIHVPATNLLATLCHSRGQRALIGRVCMDNPAFCPDYYIDESPEASLSLTTATIAHIHSLDPPSPSSLIKPIITPRFAPTCSRPALSSLGALAASFSPPLHIQTHISENKDEVALVASLFPESSSYTAVYDAHALLTPRTILAHAVHLTAAEHALIHARDAKIAHCPASNSALGSGLCPVREILDAGITVGLGTDVSGGYSPSILEAVRQACLVSRLVASTSTSPSTSPTDKDTEDENESEQSSTSPVLTVEEALYLATRGGAAVVDMADDIGGFDQGMFWDAQLVRLGVVDDTPHTNHNRDNKSETNTNIDVFGWESWPEKIHKWVWTGDDRNVRAVWVNGRLVHDLGGRLLAHNHHDKEEKGVVVTGAGNLWGWGGSGLGAALGVVVGGGIAAGLVMLRRR